MYPPKYLNLLVKATSITFTLMIAVSFHFVYYLSLRLRRCVLLSFLWKSKVKQLESVSGEVCVLKKLGGRKNMHSVFEGFFTVTMRISRPKR